MNDCIYNHEYRNGALMDCLRIVGLARIGVASTDSAANIDLSEHGYAELFETIGRLATEVAVKVEGLEQAAGQKAAE